MVDIFLLKTCFDEGTVNLGDRVGRETLSKMGQKRGIKREVIIVCIKTKEVLDVGVLADHLYRITVREL